MLDDADPVARPVLVDPRVAVRVRVVDVEEMVLRIAGAESNRQQTLLRALAPDHRGQVEERPHDLAAPDDGDPTRLLDDVEVARLAGRGGDRTGSSRPDKIGAQPVLVARSFAAARPPTPTVSASTRTAVTLRRTGDKVARRFAVASGNRRWPTEADFAECHVYLTASRWEPGGMHHVEGAQCGGPVLYRGRRRHRRDGEPVRDRLSRRRGHAIVEMRSRYAELRRRVLAPALPVETMCARYEEVIESLI